MHVASGLPPRLLIDMFFKDLASTIENRTYHPTSRRPIAGVFRKTANLAVAICVRLHIHPDAVSYASMVAAAAAGTCFWLSGSHTWLLIVGPLLCYVRLWMNMLDGMVALASGKASSRGEILNDLPDRVSDVLIFVGVAHSGLCSPFSGYWAAILALMTAYVGMLGQAVGVQREFSGVMSKPWRMVTLHIGAWIALGLIWRSGEHISKGSLTMLDWTCLIIIAGCIQTIVIRLKRIFASLAVKQSGK
jgi:phosphatidylglycerophosphate synthase